MKKYSLYLIIILLTVTDGCKCGSKSGSNDVVSPSVPVAEVKVGAVASPTHPGDFTFTIDITDALNAAGIYFRLNYDPKIMQIKTTGDPENSVLEGTFFNQGGIVTKLIVKFLDHNPDSGCLLAGLSRAGGNKGINGSGTIMTFTFTTVSAGSTSIKFSETAADNALFTPENPLESISSVKWTNADVTVK